MTHTDQAQTDTDQAAWPQILRWEWVLLAAVLAAIVITRFPTLDQRLLEAHSFRQTQTAFQTLEFHKVGVDLLRPIVPVLGSPWSIPFEFPLFQAMASVLMSWGIGADAANRLIGLGFFIVTAGALWALIRLVADRWVAGIALVVFSFSPLAMLWSRASLIEYMATAAALGWVISAVRWRQTSDWRWAAGGALLGAIAATVKVTTAIPWVVPILLFSLPSEKSVVLGAKRWFQTRLRPAFLTILAVPALASLSWTLHSDAVKRASDTTAWLTSTALRTWNLGTIEQRLNGDNLNVVLDRVDSFIIGRGWLIVAVIAVIAIRRHRAFWIGMLLVPLVAIGSFFNLYLVHDYYFVAISPALAALLAMGIRTTAVWLRIRKRWLMPTLGAITILWVGFTLGFAQNYWNSAYTELGPPEASRAIAALTDPDEYSMVFATDRHNWSPHIFYYAERRGMMLREPPLTVPLMANQPDLNRYRLLWTDDVRGPGVEYAAVRQWFAPVSRNSLLLGAEAKDLGPVEIMASVIEVVPDDSTVQPLVLSANSITCDGIDTLEIPAGSRSAWLTIRTEGIARAELRQGFVTVPSATRTIVWHPTADDGSRRSERIICFGEGRLTVESAVETTIDT